jgi:hypothetical protein
VEESTVGNIFHLANSRLQGQVFCFKMAAVLAVSSIRLDFLFTFSVCMGRIVENALASG